MWTLYFKGYFQCRLATDSDSFAEPRGRNGWTFAFDGEPDLDRVIRLHSPVAPRSQAPPAGVTVIDVNGDTAHRLVGARVSLLEDAKFEGRNGIIATAGFEPIAPFVLGIERGTFRLTRRDDYLVTSAAQRRPHLGLGVNGLSPAEATALHLQDPVAFRAARLAVLQQALVAETDAVKRRHLSARIGQITDFNSPSDIQVGALGIKVNYKHQLRHAATLVDPEGVLPGVNLTAPWDIQYWMGAWDADALQGFVQGSVSVATTT